MRGVPLWVGLTVLLQLDLEFLKPITHTLFFYRIRLWLRQALGISHPLALHILKMLVVPAVKMLLDLRQIQKLNERRYAAARINRSCDNRLGIRR